MKFLHILTSLTVPSEFGTQDSVVVKRLAVLVVNWWISFLGVLTSFPSPVKLRHNTYPSHPNCALKQPIIFLKKDLSFLWLVSVCLQYKQWNERRCWFDFFWKKKEQIVLRYWTEFDVYQNLQGQFLFWKKICYFW